MTPSLPASRGQRRNASESGRRDQGYVPLSVRHADPLVLALWRRGIDYTSAGAVRRLLRDRKIRKLPLGWWLTGAGWCPTIPILEHALRRRGHVRLYTPSEAELERTRRHLEVFADAAALPSIDSEEGAL